MKRANKGNPILCGLRAVMGENSHHHGAVSRREHRDGALLPIYPYILNALVKMQPAFANTAYLFIGMTKIVF